MDETTDKEAAALLAHAGFVKGVARGVLGRDARVDDVVQETWLAAVRKHPEQRPGVRGWLARAARNVAFSFRRGDAARTRREGPSRPPTRLPSPDEIVAREEERRRMLHAVLTLDEPYRSAVLYRYYEDLLPREIGRLLGVPAETARTRVKRGLELLRRKLLAEHGGNGRSLCIALLPLAGLDRGALLATAGSAAAAGTTATGVVVMSAKLKLATIGILALLFAGGVAWRQFGGEPLPRPPERLRENHMEVERQRPELRGGTGAPESGGQDGEPEDSPAGRPDLGTSGSSGAAVSAADRGVTSDWPGEVRGNIVSEEAGLPVEGAKIVLRYDFVGSGGKWPKEGTREMTLVTDRSGEFTYEGVAPGVYEIRIEHEEYAPRTLTGVRVGEGTGLEGISIRLISDLRELGSVAGTVLDAFGTPVVAAQVVVHSTGHGGKATAETGPDGAYLIERLLPGYYSVSLTRKPAEGEQALLWQRTLATEVHAGRTSRVDFEGSGTLRGVLLDADEQPIGKALVLLQPVERTERTADRRSYTAEDGTFTIENAGIGLHRITVGASSPGWFSVGVTMVDLGGSDQEVRIVLEAGEIAGKLLLEDGQAPLSRGLYPNMLLFPGDYRGEPKDYRHLATTMPDHTGVYRFQGLAAGKYRIRVFQTGYRFLERDVEIGRAETKEGLNLVLTQLVVGRLDVKVVDPEGKPVEGVIMNYGVKDRSGRGVRPSLPEPGRYVSNTVEAGSWDLSLLRVGMKPKHVPIVVNEGETTTVTVTMEPE